MKIQTMKIQAMKDPTMKSQTMNRIRSTDFVSLTPAGLAALSAANAEAALTTEAALTSTRKVGGMALTDPLEEGPEDPELTAYGRKLLAELLPE